MIFTGLWDGRKKEVRMIKEKNKPKKNNERNQRREREWLICDLGDLGGCSG